MVIAFYLHPSLYIYIVLSFGLRIVCPMINGIKIARAKDMFIPASVINNTTEIPIQE